MNLVTIDILNPKAVKLLKNLEDLDLISIKEKSNSGFDKFLKKLRSNAKQSLSIDKITKEVEQVRLKRHASKKS